LKESDKKRIMAEGICTNSGRRRETGSQTAAAAAGSDMRGKLVVKEERE
jgi:hypothetical protein